MNPRKASPKEIRLYLELTAGLCLLSIQKNSYRTTFPPPSEPTPYRFALDIDTKFNLENSGTWKVLPDSSRIWRLQIVSNGAQTLNLGFSRFDLPEGAKLWLYNPAGDYVEGPYIAKHRTAAGELWTPVIPGDQVVIELYVPADSEEPDLEIGKVNHGYRGFGGEKAGGEKQGSCNIDVICPEADLWRNEIRSVARYTRNGMYLCTGQLMNDTGPDPVPLKKYFMSAYHCGVTTSNDHTMVFYWNYESSTCGDLSGGSFANNQTGATYRAGWPNSDFVLVELNDPPDAAFNVFHAGWDAGGAVPSSAVTIHHPSGDEKAISFEGDPLSSTVYVPKPLGPEKNHWQVEDWDRGTTENGSSGACLFENDSGYKRCIGQLHGGYAACGNNESDWYGKLSASWNGGGTPSTRLSDWLDEGGLGVSYLNGDPHITTVDGTNYDFQGAGEYVALRAGVESEIQVRQTPIETTHTLTNPYHGLATCLSLNTAVAAQVGHHQVTYQPNISGIPDPSGLQLRVDGNLITLDADGVDLGNGGRISKTATQGGIRIDFPDNTALLVTPGWWSSQSKWYLNVAHIKKPTKAMDGSSADKVLILPPGGLIGAIASDSWLPALPDGTSVGPMPSSLDQRYIDLYQNFGNAWRVTDQTSLFDYAPGTSTDTFTMYSWPPKNSPCVISKAKPADSTVSESIAKQACQDIKDEAQYNNCVFDIMVTGETGFAKTYLASQRVVAALVNPAKEVGLKGVIIDKKKNQRDVASFKMTGVTEIKATAKGSAAAEMPLVFQFGGDDGPIYSFTADSFDAAGNRLVYSDADGNMVRCIFSKEICTIKIRYVDFDEEALDDLLSGNMTVSLVVGDTNYTDTGTWIQYDSGSGSWTKYRKDN